MYHHYNDIRSRISELPKWFDENAVPRWSEFGPREVSNIYAKECCLVLIECQDCRHQFHVAFSWYPHDMVMGEHLPALSTRVKDLHYGDPPNIECCAAGPTMNSIPRRVLEFWKSDKSEWIRCPDLEIEIPCDWFE